MESGIELLHKPVFVSSFSLVQARIATARANAPHRRPRICHGGALDPFAHGLLIMLHGPATKLFDHLHNIPKTYDATIQWGIETDNSDPTGTEISRGDPSHLTPDLLYQTLHQHIGWHEQTPPSTSNKRVGGERAYELAHRGEAVVLPPCRVYLHEATWLSHDLPNQSVLRVTVRGGYYVRALARDIGRALGCGGHLTALHRASIGPWQDPGAGATTQLSGREILPWYPSRELADQDVGDLRQAKPIKRGAIAEPEWKPPTEFTADPTPIRAMHKSRLLYLLQTTGETLTIKTNLGRGM